MGLHVVQAHCPRQAFDYAMRCGGSEPFAELRQAAVFADLEYPRHIPTCMNGEGVYTKNQTRQERNPPSESLTMAAQRETGWDFRFVDGARGLLGSGFGRAQPQK